MINANSIFWFFMTVTICLLLLRYVQVFVTEKVYRSRVKDPEILFKKLKTRRYSREDIARKMLGSFYISFFPYVPKSLDSDVFLLIKSRQVTKFGNQAGGYAIFVHKEGIQSTNFSTIDDPEVIPSLSPKKYKGSQGKNKKPKIERGSTQRGSSILSTIGILGYRNNRPVPKAATTISVEYK